MCCFITVHVNQNLFINVLLHCHNFSKCDKSLGILNSEQSVRDLSYFFLFDVGGDCGTVQTTASLTGTIGGPVDFTCTYTLGANESVISSLIIWKAETQSAVFENIATFSPPGGDPPKFLTTESGLKLRNRTDLLNVTDMGSNSYSVVMRVREVECSDENKYRCSVTFIDPNVGPVLKTSETVFTAQGKLL